MKQKKLYYFVVTLLLCVLFVVGASGVADEADLLSNQNFAIATAKLIRNNSERIFTSSNLQIKLTGILGKTDGSYVDLTRYNPDNIFKNYKKTENGTTPVEEKQIIPYKESFIKKLFNKIRNFFKFFATIK